jgi:hypothetical protein
MYMDPRSITRSKGPDQPGNGASSPLSQRELTKLRQGTLAERAEAARRLRAERRTLQPSKQMWSIALGVPETLCADTSARPHVVPHKVIEGIVADLVEAANDLRWQNADKQADVLIMLDRRLDAALSRHAPLSGSANTAKIVQAIAKVIEAIVSNGI